MVIDKLIERQGRHAHPIHIHEIAFEVVDRQAIIVDDDINQIRIDPDSPAQPPSPGESGFKDTGIAYPGQVTRIRGQFNKPGRYVWHCHIVEHEDDEMMRPYRIGQKLPDEPVSHAGHTSPMPDSL